VVTDLLPGVSKNLWWHPHSAEIYFGLRGIIDFQYGRRPLKRLKGAIGMLKIFPRMFSRKE
jgi:hypothetical protein